MGNKEGQYIDWEAVFNSVGDAIFIADNNNNVIKANAAFTRLLGAKIEDIVGKKCYELVHKSKAPWPECPFEKSKKDKKTHIEEVNDPGIGVPLLVTTSPIFNPAGEMIGVVHISKDISELKKTEEETKQRMAELERFHKVTVGRELKMKELKARIAELETKIGEAKQT